MTRTLSLERCTELDDYTGVPCQERGHHIQHRFEDRDVRITWPNITRQPRAVWKP